MNYTYDASDLKSIKVFNQAQKIEAKGHFLHIDESYEDNLHIYLYPHSYADKNPSYRQFKNALTK